MSSSSRFSIVIRAPAAERHLPVAVEPTGRVHRDRHRTDLAVFTPATAEEVAERYLDRWRLLVVPVHPQDQRAPMDLVDRHPEVRDRARALDLRQRRGRPGRQRQTGRHLPPRSGLARLPRVRPLGRPRAAALRAVPVLRADRPGGGRRQPCDVAQMDVESVEVTHTQRPYDGPYAEEQAMLTAADHRGGPHRIGLLGTRSSGSCPASRQPRRRPLARGPSVRRPRSRRSPPRGTARPAARTRPLTPTD